MNIEPDELRGWMVMKGEDEGSDKDEGDAGSKPGVDDMDYKNGTWMINCWVSNRNTSASECVGRGENNVHTQCTNKLGCACDKLEIGPQKKLSNLLQGSYSCSTGSCMRRKRSGMPGGTFRILVSAGGGDRM